jgi:hypothetical protein
MTAGLDATEGVLVGAIITGVLPFSAGSALTHSQEVLDALGLVVRRGLSPLELAGGERELFLCTGPQRSFHDPRRLIELAEATYLDFLDRRTAMQSATTCSCDACTRIGVLDLRVVVHQGAIVRRGAELSGPDALEVRALVEGPGGELVVTGAVAGLPDTLGARRDLRGSTGPVPGRVIDLAAAAAAHAARRRIMILPGDADLHVERDIAAAPPRIWDEFLVAARRQLWDEDLRELRYTAATDGSMGVGFVSHCDHGRTRRYVSTCVDSRPFEYFTMRYQPSDARARPSTPFLLTFALSPRGERVCHVSVRMRSEDRGLVSRLGAKAVGLLMRRKLSRSFDRLASIAEGRS